MFFLSKYSLVDLIAEAIERMLQTERRRDLQVVLVSEGIFDTFVGFFHKITTNTGELCLLYKYCIISCFKALLNLRGIWLFENKFVKTTFNLALMVRCFSEEGQQVCGNESFLLSRIRVVYI